MVMDPQTQQTVFSGWAIVDVLGHQRYVSRTKKTIGT